MTQALHITRPLPAVLHLALDAPPANGLGMALRGELSQALAGIEADTSVRAVVLSGRNGAFCAGDDLREAQRDLGKGDHVFHIHVNPMYITRVNGVSVKPYWCDTVALPAGGTPENPTSITFRMRFKDYVGPYILHSQMLQYSDLGMVQRVTVVPV